MQAYNQMLYERKSNRPENAVMRLFEPINNTGRNVTADNWFSSTPRLEKLLQEKLSVVGTLKTKEFQFCKEREIHDRTGQDIFGLKKIAFRLLMFRKKENVC